MKYLKKKKKKKSHNNNMCLGHYLTQKFKDYEFGPTI